MDFIRVNMSKKKQKPILSDKIAELIAPRRLLDPEVDSEDETTARAIDYDIDEDLDEAEPVSKLSDIRKKNVKLLHDVDAKYRGKVSSRKELELDSDESDEDDDLDEQNKDDESDEEEEEGEGQEDEQGEEEEEEQEEAGERSIGEFSVKLTPRQRIKLAQEADGSAEENEIESAESSDDDDEEDLKAFTSKLNKSETRAHENEEGSDSDEDFNANGKEELEKWDDDYEGEEIEEEESEGADSENELGDEEDEFGSDEEESDFDGGDIMPQVPKETIEKQDMTRILPKQQKDEHLGKGVCVQNQLQIWEKLLEVRIHSQKMLMKANSLPQPSKFEKFSTNEEFSELANNAVDQVSRLVSQMRDLQSLLLNQYTETKQIAAKRKPIDFDNIKDPEAKRIRLADELDKDFSNFKEYQYSVISKWHDRTKVLTPGSIKTQKQQGNIDVLRKIEGVLANREELIKKSQLLKGGYELFDKSTAIVEPKQIAEPGENDQQTDEQNGNNESDNTYSSEVYDDTDFYHTQLRELIEYKTSSSSNANEMAKQFTELQKLRKKMKKTVDTRASKGRKIRFVVHNKLVSFMAQNDPGKWSDEQKDELFKSLFGAQS